MTEARLSHSEHKIGLLEFHVSRSARDRYGFDQSLFSFDGKVIIADAHNARLLADAINAARDLKVDSNLGASPETSISAGDLYAMGLIDEIMHAMLAQYKRQINANLMPEILARLEEVVGETIVDEMLTSFVDEFPPLAVYRGEIDAKAYLSGMTNDIPHRLLVIEELLLLWLANANPAFNTASELFDDSHLRAQTEYLRCLDVMRGYLAVQPSLDDPQSSLLESLRAPAVHHPLSPTRQLEFMRSRFANQEFIASALDRVVRGIDLLAEENKPFFGHGPGPPVVLDFSNIGEAEYYDGPDDSDGPIEGDEPDDPYGEPNAPVRYSIDHNWMPSLVLMAKNAHVWLAQLSERYGRRISTLDQIPDEELDRLRQWGFTGLWLIGIWERSRASRRIKRIMGDNRAEASAYSLEAYRIAAELGGEGAFETLKQRAMARGIRLSTDMVPNHVGLDSEWVIEHPDWFISTNRLPFPSYSFNGEDLCDDSRVGIYLEDHYYEKSDAAVVFKRVDRSTGEVRYIYHGNDGTSMPWNDTAQLNYLNPEVREAVIQTILKVAERSPVIRFDAAMVLTTKNIHRLWFPAPGSGGDIPSRSEHSISKKDFKALMPQEFWREVVDRVQQQAPDTLLLAEAFWLLEGYFVRTLGMHRVYNSAFMNMLCAELNSEYRQLIKNTLEFDPEILKRFVNFMSNPDERTAIDQFGDGDKYFGVTTLLVTMPGLPMFGHGQIEGLYEKYGMEFVSPRWREEPNIGLITRHEKQLFAIIRKRKLFAEAENFELYDVCCVDGSIVDGSINDNVFAYSNRSYDESSLVLYNNSPYRAQGRIFETAAKKKRDAEGNLTLRTSNLGASLGINSSHASMLRAHDDVTGLEFLFATSELEATGMVIDLGAYELRVLTSMQQFTPADQETWTKLLHNLDSSGSICLEGAVRELRLAPLLDPFVELLSHMITRGQAIDISETSLTTILRAIEHETGHADLVWKSDKLLKLLELHKTEEDPNRPLLIAWALVSLMTSVVDDDSDSTADVFDDWCLDRALIRAFQSCDFDLFNAGRNTLVVRLMLEWQETLVESFKDDSTFLAMVLANKLARQYLGIHFQADRQWFRREGFEDMLSWLSALVTVLIEDGDDETLEAIEQSLKRLRAAMENSGFTVQGLERALKIKKQEPGKSDPQIV